MSAITPAPLQPALSPKRTGANTRAEILKAAAALYVEAGPARTSTRQIAQAVGISQPSLYAHFPNKDALTYALCEQAFDVLTQRMDAIDPKFLDGTQAFAHLIKDYLSFALEEPVAYQIAFMLDLSLGAYATENSDAHVGMQTFAKFHARILEFQNKGIIRSGPSQLIAQSLWASMHGLCALLLARPAFPWADLDALLACHAEMIIAGAQPLAE